MQTLVFKNRPKIVATGTIAGEKECAGVVGNYVDKILSDDRFGESSYEKAECKMLSYEIKKTMQNAGVGEEEVDMLLSGDLLNQIISASFADVNFIISSDLTRSCIPLTPALTVSLSIFSALLSK